MLSLKYIDLLQQRLSQPLPGFEAHEKMMGRVVAMPPIIPDNAKLSAVMNLIFPIDDALHIVLIRRTEDGKAHSGQVSFPGGRMDATDPDLLFTAMRELEEEVGVSSNGIQVLGALSPLYIPVSNFHVFPYVAFSKEFPYFQLSEQEVSTVLTVPLRELFQASSKTKATVTSPADPLFKRTVNAYQLKDGTIIWGATAMILSELESLLNEIIY